MSKIGHNLVKIRYYFCNNGKISLFITRNW